MGVRSLLHLKRVDGKINNTNLVAKPVYILRKDCYSIWLWNYTSILNLYTYMLKVLVLVVGFL